MRPLHAMTCALLPLAAACGGKDAPVYEAVRPVYSVTADAAAGAVGATYAGVVQARHESRLGFQASGRIVARLVDVGQRVKRGQPLMRLDPAQEVLQVAAADADVEAARTRVAQLKVDVQRTEQLLARQFASQAELDQQRLALSEAQSQLSSAAARQQIKVNQRGYTMLAADRDGVVSAVSADAGQVVQPGQAVVTVAVDGEREVVVSVPESRVDELRRARRMAVTLWAHPDATYAGTLRELAPDTDSITRTYAARIAVQRPDERLMLGMTASVRIDDVDGARAIRLPLTAVRDPDGQPRVWVVDRDTSRVASRAVTLAGAQGDTVLVASGLDGGETVVTAGTHRLHEGQRVTAVPVPGGQP